MPSPYDKMTLADLKAELDKRVKSLVGMVNDEQPPPAEGEPAEPSVTELPMTAARAQAARTAANSQGM